MSIILTKAQIFIFIKQLLARTSNQPAYFYAGNYLSRSYLSFDFALSFYGLIPETVYVCTSATEHKTHHRSLITCKGTYSYRYIPKNAFECGVNLIHEKGISFRMASPEKALCDKLFLLSPVKTLDNMRELLEDDIRIDIDVLLHLNLNLIKKLSTLYPSENVRKLWLFIKRERLCTAK